MHSNVFLEIPIKFVEQLETTLWLAQSVHLCSATLSNSNFKLRLALQTRCKFAKATDDLFVGSFANEECDCCAGRPFLNDVVAILTFLCCILTGCVL